METRHLLHYHHFLKFYKFKTGSCVDLELDLVQDVEDLRRLWQVAGLEGDHAFLQIRS